MDTVYLVYSTLVYTSTFHGDARGKPDIAFRTQEEAMAFCKFHDSPSARYHWIAVRLGDFTHKTKPAKKVAAPSPKFKVGQTIRIKSITKLEKEFKVKDGDDIAHENNLFYGKMWDLCGYKGTISKITRQGHIYTHEYPGVSLSPWMIQMSPKPKATR